MLKTFEQIQNLPYIPCPNPTHQLSPINLLCNSPTCPQFPLLCIHCEQTLHQCHQTLPLKSYLRKLLLTTKTQLHQHNLLNYTENLEKCKNQCIGFLEDFRDKIGEIVDGLVLQVQGKFGEYAGEVRNVVGLGLAVDGFVGAYRKVGWDLGKAMYEAQRNPNANTDQQSYLLSAKQSRLLNAKISHLLKYARMQPQPESHEQPHTKITNLPLQIKLLSLDFSQKCSTLTKQLQKCSQQLSASLPKITSTLSQPFPQMSTTTTSPEFSWSQTYKTSAIAISGNVAERKSGSNLERFALFQQELKPYILRRKKVVWVMRVCKLVGWIGLGVCVKDRIVGGGYKFNYENLGHGSYMISSNGYSWSSSVKASNSAYLGTFNFTTGDFIILQFQSQPTWKLTFYILKQPTLLQKSTSTPTFPPTFPSTTTSPYSLSSPSNIRIPTKCLPNNPKPDQQYLYINTSSLSKAQVLDVESGLDYSPCVNLCSCGDSVEIIG